MANRLKNLRIREVSSVDRGAGEGVRVMLFKRALSRPKKGKDQPRPATLFQHQEAARAAFGNKPSEGPKDRRGRQRHLKRDFSGKDRKRLAATGAAMPGGGYPIANVADLHNAIQAIGRAKSPGKTRAHIRSRAAALGQSALIPESWGKKTVKAEKPTKDQDAAGKKPSFPGAATAFGRKQAKALVKTAADLGAVARLVKGAVSFDEMLAEMGSTDYAEGVIEAVRDACHALKESIESIAECDDLMPNERADAISESFGEFMDHLSGIAPGNVTKAMREGVGSMSKLTKRMKKAFTSVPAHDATPPTKDKDTKVDNDADENVTAGTGVNPPKTATSKQLRKSVEKLEKRIAKADRRLDVALGLAKAEKDYMDDPDADMDEDKKKAFLDLTPEERAKFIKKNPLEKIAEKRIANLPEPVRKQLAKSADDSVELAKRVAADEAREFTKRAADVGQPAAFGEHLRTLAKGDDAEARAKALDEVMKALTAATEQARTAGLFQNFGTNHGATGTAWDQLLAKAEELRGDVAKAGTRPMTPEQAFAKVYEDPANIALVKQYNEEKRRAP